MIDLLKETLWQVRISFVGPYRIAPHPKNDGSNAFRHRSYAQYRTNDDKTLKWIRLRGYLIRAEVLKEMEFLLALHKKAGLFHGMECCAGEYAPREVRPWSPLDRRRATADFAQLNKEQCSEQKTACPLCLYLGRLPAKEQVLVHWSNFFPKDRPQYGRLQDVALKRPLNRVSQIIGKAVDHWNVWEVHYPDFMVFEGKIEFQHDPDDPPHQVARLKRLLAGALARLNTLSGGPCRVDILDGKGADTHNGHQVLIKELLKNDYEYQELGFTPYGAVPEEPQGLNFFEKTAESIVTILSYKDKKALLRPVADVVRGWRREGEDILDLPQKTRGNTDSLWVLEGPNGKDETIEKVLKDAWKRVKDHIRWVDFTEVLGEALYQKSKAGDREKAKPFRVLGGAPRLTEAPSSAPAISQSLPEGRLPDRLFLISGELTAVTPFHVGAGNLFESEQTSLRVLLTPDGHFRLPWTLLRGALRRSLSELLEGQTCNADLELPVRCECPACRLLNRIIFVDAVSKEVCLPEIRYRHQRSPHTQTADPGALFDLELGCQGIPFQFRMWCYLNEHEWQEDSPLVQTLHYWTKERLFVGGQQGTGKGRFTLKIDNVKRSLLDRPNKGLDILLLNRNFFGTDPAELAQARNGLQTVNFPDVSDMEAGVRSPWIKLEYTISLKSPALSKDPITAKYRPPEYYQPLEEEHKGCLHDSMMTHKTVYKPGPDGHLEPSTKYIFQGDGIRGLLSHAVGKIGNLHNTNHNECTCELCVAFGNQHRKGLLMIEDAELTSTPVGKVFDHVAIDRFHGGATDKGKYDDTPLLGTPKKPLEFKGNIWLRRNFAESSDKRFVQARERLAAAVMELRQGLWPLGARTGTGLGQVAGFDLHMMEDTYKPSDNGSNLTLQNLLNPPDKDEQTDNRHDQAKVETDPAPNIEDKRPSYCKDHKLPTPDLDLNALYLPYYFVKPHNDVNRESEYTSHARYHDGRYSGKLVCRLVTRGPFFIPDSEVEKINLGTGNDDLKHQKLKFSRLSGDYGFTGSHLRGVVSSVYETLTNSCFRILEEDRYLSWRMAADHGRVLKNYIPGVVIKGDKIREMDKYSFRVPVYNDRQGSNLKRELNNQGLQTLYIKDKTWRVFIGPTPKYDPRKKWHPTNATILEVDNPNSPKKVFLDVEYPGEGKRRIWHDLFHFGKNEQQEAFKKLSAGIGDKISCYVRESRFYQAVFSPPANDPDGWIEKTGYLHVSGPCKVEFTRDAPDDPGRYPKCGYKEWEDVRTNNKKKSDGKAEEVYYCQEDNVYYTMAKTHEQFFVEKYKKTEYDITDGAKHRYEELCMNYQEDNNPQIVPKEIFRSRVAREGIKTLQVDDTVWFRPGPNNTVLDIVPVRISRKVDEHPLAVLLPSEKLSSCTVIDENEFQTRHPDGLCPACRLFGTTFYKHRVRFGFAWLKHKPKWYIQEENRDLLLPLSEKPRPGWSMPPNPYWAETLKGDKVHEIPGRKFYVHHPWSVDNLKKPNEDKDSAPSDKNFTIEPLDKGNEFETEVYFDNLADWELGLLIYSIELEQGLAHKIGRGKPFGLGSATLHVDQILFRDNNQGAPNALKPSPVEKTQWVEAGFEKLEEWFGPKAWHEIEHIKALRTMLWLPPDDVMKPDVKYPDLEDKAPGDGELPNFSYPDIDANWTKLPKKREKTTNTNIPDAPRNPIYKSNRQKNLIIPWNQWAVKEPLNHVSNSLIVKIAPMDNEFRKMINKIRELFKKHGKVGRVDLLQNDNCYLVSMEKWHHAERARRRLNKEKIGKYTMFVEYDTRRGCQSPKR